METLPVPLPPTPSAYEENALAEIQRWKTPTQGWFTKTAQRVNKALYDTTDLIRKVPGVDWTIDNVVSGLLELTNEIMQDSVSRTGIYKSYHEAGLTVDAPDDIHLLSLEEVDALVKGLDTKYRALAATQGAAAGAAGAAGIVPDVLGLVALNLRAAGEYATYCGFDLSDYGERLYVLQILKAVSQPPQEHNKGEAALVPITHASHAIARQQTVQTVQQAAASGAIRATLRALGTRLTYVKFAQLMPMTGALVGGGFNAFYTAKVCDACFYLYRERLLIAKYGSDVVARNMR